MTIGLDLIGDVHGCGETLCHLLEQLGYRKVNGVYQHPQRKAIFTGDIVDRGPNIRLALNRVRDMVEGGHAEMVMGNHEYNVYCFCTPDPHGIGFMREHNRRNTFIVQATLDQFMEYEDEWQDHLKWFARLPLFIEKDECRIVHACWQHELIDQFKKQTGGNRLSPDYLEASVDRDSIEGKTMDILTRGTSLKLPNNRIIEAKDGFIRHFYRTKFWLKQPEIYEDIVFQPDPLPKDIAKQTITDQDREKLYYYGPEEKPLFIGHYWMSGLPSPLSLNIACLDYSAVKYGRLVAYRFDGEKRLVPGKFAWIRVEKRENHIPLPTVEYGNK